MIPLVLIIEKNDKIRSNLFNLLEAEDLNVISAKDGYLGLQLAEQMQPDLILCALNLPKITGYEILRRLREKVTTARIPFIFLTSESDIGSRCWKRQREANGDFSQPLNLNKSLESMTNQFTRLNLSR